jgi:hypothetical protein
MRYPKNKPFQCTTIESENGRVYCYNTQQVLGANPGTNACILCQEHYSALSNKEEIKT